MPESAQSTVELLPRAPLQQRVAVKPPSKPAKNTQEGILPFKPSARNATLFAEYYLQGNSAYKSAILAGYSESTARAASVVLLKNKTVISILQARTKEKFEELRLTTDSIIVETAKIANANILDYLDIDEKSNAVVNLNIITRDMGAAIQEFGYDGNGRPRIKLADKRPAQELMMRYFKLLNDKGDGGGGDTKPLTVSALDSIIAEKLSVTINQTTNNQYNYVESESEQRKLLTPRPQLKSPDTIVAQ